MGNNKVLKDRNSTWGVALLGLGVLLLVFNVLGLSTGPLVVTFIGLGLFVAMMMLGKSFGWIAVPASVMTMLGLILIYTNLPVIGSGRSWAYAWTLLFGAAGMGILVSHYWSGQPADTRFGTFLVRGSLIAFVVMGLMFELLFFSRGLVARLAWPAVLILLGGYLLLRARGAEGGSNAKPRIAPSVKKNGEPEFEPLKKKEKEEAR